MSAPAITDSLREVTGSLTSLFQEADRMFLTVGDRLGRAISIVGTLTGSFDGLPREIESEEMREATDTLRRVAREVSAMGTALAEESAALARLLGLNQDVGFRIERLRKTVRVIAILASNAQIAAASIDARHEDFTTFTREVARLTSTVGATIEGYTREYQQLAELLRSAAATQAGFEREHRHMLQSVEQEVEASLQALAGRREKAAGAAVEIGSRSTAISKAVSAAVMALQISDITRQRVEHVGHALHLLEEGLHPGGTEAAAMWSAALSAEQKEAVASGVSRLQSTQIAHAAGDYETEIKRIATSLKTMAEDASAMITLGKDVFGTGERKSESFLEALDAKLRSTGALVQKCQAARGEVDQVIEGVTRSLNELLRQVNSVRDIEVDMRLVGLNMALKCGRLGGEGETLRVIARELRGYAQQILADADALMAAVREVVGAAGTLASERRDQGGGKIGTLEQDMARSMQRFHDGGGRLSEALAGLTREGSAVQKLLQETADYLAAHDRVGEVLLTARTRLDRIAGATEPRAQDGIVKDRVQSFAQSQYTMAVERDIHQQFGASGGKRPGPAEAAPQSVDDMLF